PSLLTLPPDIRLRIYTPLLTSPHSLKGPTARQSSPEKPLYNIHTAILRVNKQINTEARHVFFGMNVFSLSAMPPVQEVEDEEEDGSGAFEPPLQLKDLALVRRLEIDLVYAGPRTGAERYIQNLSFVLGAVKSSLIALRIAGDSRAHATQDGCAGLGGMGGGDGMEEGGMDVKTYLRGFLAASSSPRFLDALAALHTKTIALGFDFEDVCFRLSVEKDVLAKGWLVWIVGQVLVARTEIGIRDALGEL
ncbi:hypothetical protein CC86DRAFT_274217, partial [Ophiobolus disseminans]